MLAVLLAAVFPYLTPKPMNLRADTNDLVANLRLARDLAISRTTRYRVVVRDRTSYALQRGTWDGVRWTFADERVIRLRENVQFSAMTRDGQGVEFDSRGRPVGTGGLVGGQLLPLTLEDQSRGERRSVLVTSVGGVVEQ
jgi:Tfp pilus assembly protein FimT